MSLEISQYCCPYHLTTWLKEKTTPLVRLLLYSAFWVPFHTPLWSSWVLSIVSIMKVGIEWHRLEINYFFPFAQRSSFPKSKLREMKLIKSIYVRHHEQSCSTEFMLPIKQSLLLIGTDCWGLRNCPQLHLLLLIWR